MADLTTVHDALGAGEGGPIWLLDLDTGSRVFRVADTQTEAGGYLYEAGLDPLTISDNGDLLASVAVSISIGENWAALIADGLALELASATLRRWWPGQDIRHAEVILSGAVTEPEWGASDEPLTISIARESETGQLLDAQALVDDTTWPDDYRQTPGEGYALSPSAEGAFYTLIFGYPGMAVIGVGTVSLPATPALLASVRWSAADPPAPYDDSFCIVAGHPVDADAVSVTVWGDEKIRSETRTIQHVEDALGRTVAGFDFVSSGLPAFGETPEIWVGWSDASGLGGGMIGPDGSVLRKAGDVIDWVLRNRTTRRVDWGRMASVLPTLNAYKVDTYVNGQIDAWEWLEQELFRLLPVAVVESDKGLYLKSVRWDATKRDAVAHLDADSRLVDRVSRLVSLNQPIENQIEVSYRQKQGESFANRRWVSAQVGRLTDGLEDSRVLYHPRCAASQARYGLRPRSEPVEAAWVYDDPTAERIAKNLGDRYALPMRSVRYEGDFELDPIEVWDVVTVTDSEISLSEAVALVSQRTVTDDGISLDLILLPRS